MTEHRPPRSPLAWRLLVLGVFIVAGFFFVVSAKTAGGSDLRPTGGSLATLLRDDTDRLEGRQRELASLTRDVEQLTSSSDDIGVAEQQARSETLEAPTGLSEVAGPGLRVTLDDAPRDQEVLGLDMNALVVHQQDIQAYVNALWEGGAQAITLQGQRIIATTAIKCVGSTVVLDGVPYVPPYEIEAVGDPVLLQQAVDASPAASLYAQYAERYRLGLQIETVDRAIAPAYGGSVALRHAQIIDD